MQQLPSSKVGMFAVLAGSRMVESAWKSVVHPLYIVSALNNGAGYLGRIIDKQNTNLSKYEARGKPIPAELGITVVLDDCASIGNIMRSKELAYLAANGRHCHIAVFVLTQYYNQITTSVRCNIDIMFVLSTANVKTIAKLRDEYASCVSMRVFRYIINTVTNDYGCLVIDNRVNAKSSENCFSLRIQYPFEESRLGSDAMWSFATTHYLNVDDRAMQERVARQGQLMSDTAEGCDASGLSEHDIENLKRMRSVYSDKFGRVTIKTVSSKHKLD